MLSLLKVPFFKKISYSSIFYVLFKVYYQKICANVVQHTFVSVETVVDKNSFCTKAKLSCKLKCLCRDVFEIIALRWFFRDKTVARISCVTLQVSVQSDARLRLMNHVRAAFVTTTLLATKKKKGSIWAALFYPSWRFDSGMLIKTVINNIADYFKQIFSVQMRTCQSVSTD